MPAHPDFSELVRQRSVLYRICHEFLESHRYRQSHARRYPNSRTLHVDAILPTTAVRLYCLPDDFMNVHGRPASVGEHVVDLRQGDEAALDGARCMVDRWSVAKGLEGDGLHGRQGVFHPVVQFTDQEVPVSDRLPQLIHDAEIPADVPTESASAAPPPPPPVQIGVAGASLDREYQRRVAKREHDVRKRHPRIGGVILALTDDPQTTKAFRSGARGEQQAAARITERCGTRVLFLLNRKLGKGRRDGDIDMIAITAGGVHVIDVKRYQDATVEVRRSGGLFRQVSEQLYIGGRDRTHLLRFVGQPAGRRPRRVGRLSRQRKRAGNALAVLRRRQPAAVGHATHRRCPAPRREGHREAAAG